MEIEEAERQAENFAARTAIQQLFAHVVASFGSGPALILTHNDADGLSAGTILFKALERAGFSAEIKIVGRGENPWSAEMRTELAKKAVGGLIVADLGVHAGEIRKGTPTVIIDHHIPRGSPGHATVISGHGLKPIPTASLLAFRCASAIAEVDDLLWLAALGIIGDMAGAAGFVEFDRAKTLYGITALRRAASLVNQPRRSSSGNATPALALLLKANSTHEIMSGKYPETQLLLAAREDVKAELERVRPIAPKIVGKVALIKFASPCQVHPLVAQAWISRLKTLIVMAANTGFRTGWVHFAMRTSTGENLVEFLRIHAPAGVDENHGGGHAQASGGALRIPQWNELIRSLGFGPDMEVRA